MGGYLQGEWDDFWRACFPPGDPPPAGNQEAEMRRAFYAGAWIACRALAADPGRLRELEAESRETLGSMIRKG